MMKRFTAMILTFLLLILTGSGCRQTDKPKSTASDGKVSVVCTNFPQYDWVRQILGSREDSMNLTFLMDDGVDPHNYQITVGDIVKISNCDLFIYVGGESDKWVNDAFADAANPNRIVINLLDTLGEAAKIEEIVEGMEEDKDDADEEGYDEHVWLSLKNAELFCSVITDALTALDTEYTEVYRDNLAVYTGELAALDGEYQTVVNTASIKTLLFGDRFPFRYLADEYGLNYHAAFPGCSAETEASFDTIIWLAGKADALNLHTIMVTESADQSIARTIISNTTGKNQQILVLNSMQSVTAGNVKSGTTYLSIMESNLNILKEALR